MPNYNEGKIYKIVCKTTGLAYIGSTTKELSFRLAQHKHKYKYRSTSSSRVLENNNFEIILLEEFPCNGLHELLTRERYYIENNTCVNIGKPIRTPDDIQVNKEKSKQRYALNREKRLEKIICDCGTTYSACNRKSHYYSQKHKAFDQQLKNISLY